MRAKIRQAAGTQSLLTIKARRERAVAALQQAALAIDAASKLAKGEHFRPAVALSEIFLESRRRGLVSRTPSRDILLKY